MDQKNQNSHSSSSNSNLAPFFSDFFFEFFKSVFLNLLPYILGKRSPTSSVQQCDHCFLPTLRSEYPVAKIRIHELFSLHLLGSDLSSLFFRNPKCQNLLRYPPPPKNNFFLKLVLKFFLKLFFKLFLKLF